MRTLTTQDRTRLGDTIRNRRDDLGISQRVLAKRAGISPGTIVSIEKGREVTDQKMKATLRALDLELDTRGRETKAIPGGTPMGGTGLDIEVFLNMLRAWLVTLAPHDRAHAMDSVSDAMQGVTDTLAGRQNRTSPH